MFNRSGILLQCLCYTSCVFGTTIYANESSVAVLACPFRTVSSDFISWNGPPSFVQYTIGPQINTQLTFHARLLVIGDTNNGEYNLQISNVQDRDGGSYRCSNSDNSKFVTVTFTVTAKPISEPLITQTPNGQVTVGTTITLTCKVYGGKPVANITWQCQEYFGVKDQSSLTTASSSITMNVTKMDNNKMCICTASHPLWSPDKTNNTVLDVAYPPDVNPTIQQNPLGGIVAGRNVTLTCTVFGGNPLVTLNWDCEGVNTNTTTSTTASYGVTFTVEKNSNNKVCTCSAMHPVISYRPTVKQRLNVYFSPDDDPKIVQTPSGWIKAGSEVKLVCTVSGGNPLAVLQWSCDGIKTHNTSSTTASYSVTFQVDESFNNKVCTCSATHSDSSYTPSVHQKLVVYYYTSEQISIQQQPAGPIIAGKTVILKCSVSGGNPLATLSWNCTGPTINSSTETTASYSVELTVNENYNNRICSCSASHPTLTISPTAQHNLVVYYVPDGILRIQQMPIGGIVRGKTVKLICLVDGGNPLAILTWNCSGTFVNNTSGNTARYSVEFVVEQNDNNRICNCEATHNISTYKENVQQTIVVYYPPVDIPHITQTPTGAILTGRNVKLTCEVSGGNPLATLSWNCTGTKGNNTIGTTSSYSVEFPVFKIDNKRICTCITTHPDLAYNHIIEHQLIVHFGPGKPNIKVEPSMPWLEGNRTHLMCMYEEGNPVAIVNWTRNNTVKSSFNNPIFTFGKVSKEDDNSLIKCVVFNEYDTMDSDALYLNIEYMPEIYIENQTIYTVEGNDITVQCKATGNPSPRVSWVSGTEELVTPDASEAVLSVADIDRSRDGNYTCRAISVSDTHGDLVSMKEILIVVYFPPDVNVNKNSTSLSENTDLKLTCNANGKPQNYTYEWEHTFGIEFIRTLPSTTETLILSNMSYEDIGKYACFVNNGIKDRQGTLKQANHTIVELQFTPVFVLYDKLTTGKDGNNVTSTVEFISFPEVKMPVQWRNGTQNTALENTSNICMTLEKTSVQANLHGIRVSFNKYAYRSSINFFNFNEKQDGFYNLLVNNSVGVNDLTVRIVLSDRPKPPTHFSASVIGSTEVTLTWTGGFNGGNNQTFIIAYWKIPSGLKYYARISEEKDKTDYVLDIPKLMPSTTYVFSINATNYEGYSDYVNNTIRLSTKDIPESASSIVGPVGGAIGGIVAAAIIIIAIIVFVRQRQVASTNTTDRKTLTFKSTEEDEDGGLHDNVLYESAGEQFKATPGPIGDVYAVVKKSNNTKTDEGLIQETALYAEIKKKTVQSNAGDVHRNTGTNKTDKLNKKGKLKEQKKRHDDVYENITERKTTNTQKIKNKDGLVYADLVFKDDGKRKFIIRGIENKTDYADIDLELKADPLPSDESEEDDTQIENK